MEARMKAKISIILLALVAVAFLAVAPAAADLTIVPPGGVAFVGEEGLTFESTPGVAVPAGTTLMWFAAGDNPATASAAATYLTQGAKNEVISPATFQTRTGNWYTVVAGVATPIINVQMPAIDVKVFNTVGGEDMTNKRVVKAGTSMVFRLDSNLYQIVNQRPALPGQSTDIKVVVVGSEGTTYTALVENAGTGAVSGLTGLVPTNSQFFLPNSAGVSGIAVPNWDLDSAQYKSGVYTFYAEVNLNKAKDNVGTVTGVTKSAVKTIELSKDDVKIESNKDTVVRNNDFAVTITGRPNTGYALWVKGTSSIATDTVPYIKANQNGVALGGAGAYVFTGVAAGPTVAGDISPTVAPAGGAYQALVTLSSSGTRTVGFGTDDTTKDQSYTIRADIIPVPAVFPYSPTYDTVKVKVEKGGVTITASGDSSYYIGEEIVISGTNTDSSDTWLFITGPNLKSKGAPIFDPKDGVQTGTAAAGARTDDLPILGSWAPVSVETDDTWEYKWNTAGVNLDTGSYTIYAVTTPTNKDDFGSNDAIYKTATIRVKKPFVTATSSSLTVAKGDDLYIKGSAEGDPDNGIAVWTFGTNFVNYQTESVEDDGSFEYKFTGTDTLAAGQYFVVVQHPMENGRFDLTPTAGNANVFNWVTGNIEFNLDGRQGSEAATALIDAMNSNFIDDTYYKLTFMVEEPWIVINAIGDKNVGDSFVITGTTNLAVGDQLIVETKSASFKLTDKTQASGFSGGSGTVTVTAGDKDGENVWELNVDTAAFIPDQYIVTVQAIEASLTGTQTFNVMKAEPTTKPTEPVETPVVTATPVKTAEPTPDTTATPGFGVLVALIGLGAVAALIVRKD
jgi:PGF-CTERM protein